MLEEDHAQFGAARRPSIEVAGNLQHPADRRPHRRGKAIEFELSIGTIETAPRRARLRRLPP
jgi:hypothetical protein